MYRLHVVFKLSHINFLRFYTRFFGRLGDAGKALCCHALLRYPEWESKIDAWQKPILENE